MVGDMLRKDDERHGDIRHGDRAEIGADIAAVPERIAAFERRQEGKFGIPLHILEFGEIDDFKSVHFGRKADSRKDRR